MKTGIQRVHLARSSSRAFADPGLVRAVQPDSPSWSMSPRSCTVPSSSGDRRRRRRAPACASATRSRRSDRGAAAPHFRSTRATRCRAGDAPWSRSSRPSLPSLLDARSRDEAEARILQAGGGGPRGARHARRTGRRRASGLARARRLRSARRRERVERAAPHEHRVAGAARSSAAERDAESHGVEGLARGGDGRARRRLRARGRSRQPRRAERAVRGDSFARW